MADEKAPESLASHVDQLAELNARLASLETVLTRLCAAVERQAEAAVSRPAAAPVAAVASAGVRRAPPSASQKPKSEIKQAAALVPTMRNSGAAGLAATPKASGPKADVRNNEPPPATDGVKLPPLMSDDDLRALELKELDIGQFLPPENAEPRDIIAAMFRFAVEENKIASNALLLGLIHSTVTDAPRSAEHLKSFNFPKMRRNLHFYLENRDPQTFALERAEEDADGRSLKVFVHRLGGGMPAPVRMRRDPESANAWRVVQLSL